MKPQLPNFLSTNVRSLFPKLEEFELLLEDTVADIVAIIYKNMAHEVIDNNYLKIPNYNFFDVIDYMVEEEEFVPLYQKLSLPNGAMTSKIAITNVCGFHDQ